MALPSRRTGFRAGWPALGILDLDNVEGGGARLARGSRRVMRMYSKYVVFGLIALRCWVAHVF